MYETTGQVEIHIGSITSNNTSTWSTGVNNLTGSTGAAAPNRNNNETGAFLSATNEGWHFEPPHNYTFDWQPAAQITGSNTLTSVTGLPVTSPTTTYSVTVYDPVSGCTNTSTVDVSVLPIPGSPTILPSSATVCASNSVALTATPVNPLNSIKWYSAATGGTLVFAGNTLNTPPLTHDSTFYAEENNGSCGGTRTPVTVTHINAPSITVTNDNPSYCGTPPSPLVSNLVVSSSNANYTYAWTESNAGTLNTTIGDSVIATNTQTTSYLVTATDAGTGCIATGNTAVSIFNFPSFTASATPGSVCGYSIKS